jgi:hypothetical protein
LIQPTVLESVLGENEKLVIKANPNPLRRDSVSLVNTQSGDTVKTVYRRGRQWKLVDKELELPESKLFSLSVFKKKLLDKKQELSEFKTVSLPGLKKKLVISPPDSEFGLLSRTLEYLANKMK